MLPISRSRWALASSSFIAAAAAVSASAVVCQKSA
jgi:hypothetical protein